MPVSASLEERACSSLFSLIRDLAERLHLTALQLTHEGRHNHNADHGDKNLLCVLRCKGNKAVVGGEKVQCVAEHHRAAEEAARIAEKGGADHQPRNENHVGIGNMEEHGAEGQRGHHKKGLQEAERQREAAVQKGCFFALT